MNDLPTIVVPYYKRLYLAAALASLAGQTRQGFKVFIGDDASPEDPAEIIQKYQTQLDIRYHRFPENLGRTSLTRHWNRCVRETDSEWVWLFSDDDLASPDCLESFGSTLAETRGSFDVYRFNTKIIDGNDIVTLQPPVHPPRETGEEFALAKILGKRFSFAVEHIFRRSAFDEAGGFVDFPLAWCADDASWIAFARRNGFRTIEKGEVRWRKSSVNISSPRPEQVKQKLAAFHRYLLWLKQEFPDPAFQKKLRTGIRRLFPTQVQHWGGKPKLMDGLKFWFFFSCFTGHLNPALIRAFLGLPGFGRNWRLAAQG